VASLSTVGSILAHYKPAGRRLAPAKSNAASDAHNQPPMSGLFSVLRHRDFRLLWLAGLASVLGDRIVTVALALFVIDLTGNATDLGIVLAAHAIPLVGFMLIGGIWADRVPRHRLMVLTDLIRFVLHAALAALIISGEVAIWHVVVIEALFGTAEAFFRPASTAVIPQTVPESEIQEANALVGMSNNICEFAGPALATALVLGVGAGEAFAVDAATFLISAALLVRMSPRRREAAAGADLAEDRDEDDSMVAQLRAGYEEVRARAWVWATLIAACALVFFGLAPWFVLGPIVAEENYGGTDIYGIVTAALGAGTIVGSILGIRWRPRHPMRVGLVMGSLWCPMQVAYALGAPLGLVLPAAVVGGFGFALFDIWWLTALAERIPPDRLSRVSSYDWMLSLGLLPVGYLLAGPLADAVGAIEVLAVGSALAMAAWLLALIPRETRALERITPSGGREPITGEHRIGFPDI
jgi:MFS family permease